MPKSLDSIGFIGAGRMATALARGCVQAGLVKGGQVLAADPHQPALQAFADQIPDARLAGSNPEVLSGAHVVIMAVKPQIIASVLAGIAKAVQQQHLLVSIAAGVTLNTLSAALPAGTRLVRVMPNTPCLVGLGASGYSRGSAASDADGKLVKQILESVGLAFELDEALLDAVTGLSGSGPAFVYRLIAAMAEGGAAGGLPSELAVKLAAQTARGAAEMVLTTGQSPAKLCEQVTSPGGTTLAGLEVLEGLNGPDAFRVAIEAATRRSKELGQT